MEKRPTLLAVIEEPIAVFYDGLKNIKKFSWIFLSVIWLPLIPTAPLDSLEAKKVANPVIKFTKGYFRPFMTLSKIIFRG